MARMGSKLFRVVFVVMMVFGAMGTTANAADDDTRILQRIVVDMTRAEYDKNYGALYDYVIPDSRDLLPRHLFVQWYADQAFPVPNSEPEILEIQINSGSSDLSGVDYDQIATVQYGYRTDAQDEMVEREVRFAKIDDTWRMMLEFSRQELGEATGDMTFSVEYESPYSTEIYVQLDTFWAQVFADAGVEYSAPADMIGIHTETMETGCGLIEDVTYVGAMYCTLDQTIYYDPKFRDYVVHELDQYAWDHIMAHEWAHHVQNVLGLGVTLDPELYGGHYSIEHELQADCLAAVFTQDAFARDEIRRGDLRYAEIVTKAVGDPRGVSWDDQDAHGTGEQRVESFWQGYEDGLRGCHLRIEAPNN